MFRKSIPAVLATSALLLVGCDDDDNDNDVTQARVQAVHASPDAPLANVLVNGSAALSGVDYATASGYVPLSEGQNGIQVDVQLPGGEVATVIPNTVLDLDSSLLYTVMVVGQADPSAEFAVEPLVVTRSAAGDGDTSNVDVQVVHASPGVPDVDLHVTGPDDVIDPASALATLGYKDSTGVVSVPAADYRVRLTLAGTDTVAFDSGTVPLPAGAELTIAAIPNVNKSATATLSPVKLLVMDGTASSVIYDAGEIAQVRVGHLSSDAPEVDVALNGSEAISDLVFTDVTGYVDLAATAYDIGVYAFNDPNTLQIDAQGVAFDKGLDYSVYAINALANIEPLVVVDDRRSVVTSASLSVIHAASVSAAAVVDVYLTGSSDITNSDPALPSFAYKDIVKQVYVAGGTYFVTVTAPGTKDVILGPTEITVENGKVYKAIATNGGLLAADITE